VAVAVWGGVGVGKTALVLEYAHRRRERYAVLWYVNASSRTSVTDGIEALAVRLGVRLPTTDREAHLHLLWDALRQAGRWLLIFDDAEHPADLADHWPSVGGGHVLVTSLNPDWGHRARLLELGVFSRAETVHYLRSRTGRSDASDDELARELDGLALACEQAAAYMRQTGLAAGEYLPLFRRRRAQLLERGAPDDHRDTIGTTWRLALAQLSEASPGSVQLLLLCAQLAPEAVPLDLLRSSVVILPEELHRVVHDDLALEDAIGHIRRYSLMSRDGDHLQMHRLVQAVVRGAMPPRERALWWRRALRLLVDRPPAAPGDLASWSCWQAFLPHIAFLTEELAAASPGEGDEMIALPEDARRGFVEIVHRAAEYLVVRGSFDDAQNLLSCLLTVLRRPASGDGYGAVAATLVLLGEVVERLGRAEEALRDYRTALDVLGPRHGPDHPWVARASTGLARMLTCHEGATRWQPENLAEAEESFVRSLSVLTAQLGQGHPVVAQTLAGLGQIRQDRGDPLTAVACFEEALATLEQVYGPDHPDVGHAHDRLGYALRLVGDHAGARAGHERALAVLTHAYGEGHVETGWPWSNLGVLLLDGGLTHEAVAAQERAHAVFEANLGQTVPTQIAAWRLALAHARAGAAETARELLASVVPRLAALLGERHPDAVAATADLDHVIRLSGSRADGLEGLRQLPKVPGPKRPEAADRAAELR
jgi:tetratricopeptide (TPR) repeat protein